MHLNLSTPTHEANSFVDWGGGQARPGQPQSQGNLLPFTVHLAPHGGPTIHLGKLI